MLHVAVGQRHPPYRVVLGSIFSAPRGQPNGHPVLTQSTEDDLAIDQMLEAMSFRCRTEEDLVAWFEGWASGHVLSLAMLLRLAEEAPEPIDSVANNLLLQAIAGCTIEAGTRGWLPEVGLAINPGLEQRLFDRSQDDPTEIGGWGFR